MARLPSLSAAEKCRRAAQCAERKNARQETQPAAILVSFLVSFSDELETVEVVTRCMVICNSSFVRMSAKYFIVLTLGTMYVLESKSSEKDIYGTHQHNDAHAMRNILFLHHLKVESHK